MNVLYKGDTPLATTAPEVVDNLTTNDSTKALSAKQGKVLNDKIEGSTNTTQTMNGIQVDFVKKGQLKYLRFSDGSTTNAMTTSDYLGTISNASYFPSSLIDIKDTVGNVRFVIDGSGKINPRQNVSAGTIIRGSFVYF